MNMKKLVGAALAMALAWGPASHAQEPKPVTIAHTPSLAGGVPKIAVELGLFEKHGLSPRLIQMDSASATATAIVSRSADVALSGPGELVAAQVRGVDMIVIANIYNGLNGTLVLSRQVADDLGVSPDAPVEERLSALDGLLLASTSATSAFTISSREAIESAGAEARFAFMGQPAMQAALESGAVQGYVAGAPYWTVPVLNGTGYAWVSGPKGEFPPELTPASSAGAYMMRSRYDEDPDLAQRLTAVFTDLSSAFGENPDEVRAAIARAHPTMDPRNIDAFYEVELRGFMAQPPTVEDMQHEIDFIKLGGANLPGIDDLDPADLLPAKPSSP